MVFLLSLALELHAEPVVGKLRGYRGKIKYIGYAKNLLIISIQGHDSQTLRLFVQSTQVKSPSSMLTL